MKTPLKDGWIIATAVFVAAVLLAVVLVYGLTAQERAVHGNCVRLNRLEDAITTILEASQAGLPANRYYRRHPHELQKALKASRRDLRLIRGARCLN